MRIKGLVDEDFLQYKKPSMFVITSYCTFKCEKEANCPGMCQNSDLAKAQNIDVNNQYIVDRYLKAELTKAIVFGGLEPLDQFDELLDLIQSIRAKTDDDIVIYTGYNKNEIENYLNYLIRYPNIIVKFGRYIPNMESHLDPVLGVYLASPNQYAEKIS